MKDSVLTSGAYSDLGTSGFYGQTAKPSDYGETNATAADDAALIVVAGASDNAMQTTATFDHSTITGDILSPAPLITTSTRMAIRQRIPQKMASITQLPTAGMIPTSWMSR